MATLKGQERQKYVADLFSRIAKHYDLMNTLMTFGMHRRWKKSTAKLTCTNLSGVALDIATGTGDLAVQLASQPGIKHSVGIDLIPEMINLAKLKSNKIKLSEKTTFIIGDAVNLPFPDNTFACATAGFSLRNMPDLNTAIQEMVRVVKPEGRITTLELTPMNNGLRGRIFRFYFHRIVPLVGYIIARDRSAYTYLPQSVDYFLESDGLAEVMRSAGLLDVGYQKVGCGTVAIHHGIKI